MKRILFLMSDTGGGHRSAAEAISDALKIRYGEANMQIELVDVFRACHWPLNKMPEFYPWIVNKSARAWGWGYRLANMRPIYSLNKRMIYYGNRQRLHNIIQNHAADVVISVHSVITPPMMYAYQSLSQRPPFITVVTDLVSTPRYWYDPRVDFTFLPTQKAYERGLRRGLEPERMRVVGLPVHPRFSALRERATVRAEHGWDDGLPVVMMVAGMDGMGRLYHTARAIDAQNLNCRLAIITGKNAALKARLEAQTWNQPTDVYGFVRDMADKMTAADMLVTKAGPATISEAFIAGLPVILSDRIPGQEDGNVTHVVENGAGVYAPTPTQVAGTVAAWLADDGAQLRQRKANARRLANPSAVWQVADAIWEYAHAAYIPAPKKSSRSARYRILKPEATPQR